MKHLLKNCGLLLLGCLGLISMLGGCYGYGPGDNITLPIEFADDFESAITTVWHKGADVPEDPNHPDQKVDWHIEQSALQMQSGSYSAEFYLDGRQDDGTIWLARSFQVPKNKPVTAHLYFELYSKDESFNQIANVVAYAGSQTPSLEADFADQQPANQSKGWRPYHFQIPVATNEGTVVVAFGISAIFETPMTYYLDSVKIVLDKQ